MKPLSAQGTENTGHGHVFVRPDGVRTRCGGPGGCKECSRDLARLQGEPTTAVEIARLRAEQSRDHFGEHLRIFVRRWSRRMHPHEAQDFQIDLTRLMVDAMGHKSDCLSLGVNTYAENVFEQMAMRPLHVIMERPKQ